MSSMERIKNRILRNQAIEGNEVAAMVKFTIITHSFYNSLLMPLKKSAMFRSLQIISGSSPKNS